MKKMPHEKQEKEEQEHRATWLFRNHPKNSAEDDRSRGRCDDAHLKKELGLSTCR